MVLIGHLLGISEILARLGELIIDHDDGAQLRVALGELAELFLVAGYFRIGHLHLNALVLGHDVINERNLIRHNLLHPYPQPSGPRRPPASRTRHWSGSSSAA